MKKKTLVLLSLILTSCNPLFVMRGAIEEADILLSRVPIEEALQKDEYTAVEKEKLALVLEAREFAKEIGLTANRSFTYYSKLDRDTLAWVIVASRFDAFRLYTWWYPIVGSVPYKGYFEKDQALCAEKRLQGAGYETWVRGTDAMSTLGWFNDPVLSSSLQRDEVSISNTVIHEIFHQTVWVPGHVPFNESCAHFLATRANEQFYERKLEECQGKPCEEKQRKLFEYALRRLKFEAELSELIMKLYTSLDELYRDPNKSEVAKIVEREVIFEDILAPFREKYPRIKALREINNAEIIQLKIYLTEFKLFEQLLNKKCNGKWNCFLEEIRTIAERVKEDPSLDAFAELRKGAMRPQNL